MPIPSPSHTARVSDTLSRLFVHVDLLCLVRVGWESYGESAEVAWLSAEKVIVWEGFHVFRSRMWLMTSGRLLRCSYSTAYDENSVYYVHVTVSVDFLGGSRLWLYCAGHALCARSPL